MNGWSAAAVGLAMMFLALGGCAGDLGGERERGNTYCLRGDAAICSLDGIACERVGPGEFLLHDLDLTNAKSLVAGAEVDVLTIRHVHLEQESTTLALWLAGTSYAGSPCECRIIGDDFTMRGKGTGAGLLLYGGDNLDVSGLMMSGFEFGLVAHINTLGGGQVKVVDTIIDCQSVLPRTGLGASLTAAEILLQNVTVRQCESGITVRGAFLEPSQLMAKSIQIVNNSYGFVFSSVAGAQFEQSNFEGNGLGLSSADGSNLTIVSSRFAGNGLRCEDVFFCGGILAQANSAGQIPAEVHGSSFVANGVAIRLDPGFQGSDFHLEFDASNNWWNDPLGPSHRLFLNGYTPPIGGDAFEGGGLTEPHLVTPP